MRGQASHQNQSAPKDKPIPDNRNVTIYIFLSDISSFSIKHTIPSQIPSSFFTHLFYTTDGWHMFLINNNPSSEPDARLRGPY